MDKKKLAVVLSGGGGKGAYQAGVWKALKKMNIRYHIVTGTSIGALNGVMMVQHDLNKCIKVWETANFNYICDDKNIDSSKTKDVYKKYLDAFLHDGGFETDKIKKLVRRVFNPIKFYFSNVDFGIVTYNLTTRKPENIKKKYTLKDDMIDFIVASATCFPAFKQKNINESMYIDGGYYDNLPINLAIEMGATSVIAVDLKAIGFKKKVKYKNIDIVNIKPRNKIVSFLVFDETESKRAMKLGYNDTMKTFNHLDGDKYTFFLNDLDKNYYRYVNRYVYKAKEILKHEKQTKNVFEKFINITLFNKIISTKEDDVKKIFNDSIEFIGHIFKIDETKIYDINEYNNLALNYLYKIEKLDEKDIENKVKTMDLKKLYNSQYIIKFIYDKISNKNISLAIVTIFPKEFFAALYLYIIKNN